MPPIPSELRLLLDNLIAQVQQQQARTDTMQTYMQAELDKLRQGTDLDMLKNIQSVQEEKIRRMSEEVNELKKQLQETKDEIIKSQKDSARRTIYVQGTLLMLILSTVIGIAVKLIFH